jgi:hypothetical protein
MSIPEEILEMENRCIGPNGKPCYGQALELALGEWRGGNKDRELVLHVLFLAWYCNIEPDFLTGINQTSLASTSLEKVFQEVYSAFSVAISADAEALYVVGLMAHISPWLLGEDVPTWEARSKEFQERYRELLPDGISPDRFKGRGAFGDYFAGQAAVEGGY